jgi:hypothetical protein
MPVPVPARDGIQYDRTRECLSRVYGGGYAFKLNFHLGLLENGSIQVYSSHCALCDISNASPKNRIKFEDLFVLNKCMVSFSVLHGAITCIHDSGSFFGTTLTIPSYSIP